MTVSNFRSMAGQLKLLIVFQLVGWLYWGLMSL